MTNKGALHPQDHDRWCERADCSADAVVYTFLSAKNTVGIEHCRRDQTSRAQSKLVQSRPLVRSTDIRSTRLYGQFIGCPKIAITECDVRSAPMPRCKVSLHFIGQKTWTLQAGAYVLRDWKSRAFPNAKAIVNCVHKA